MLKITPHLWFDRRMRDAVELYTAAFANSRVKTTTTLTDTPSGAVEIVPLALAGQEFLCLFAGSEFKFTPAISFVAGCETPDEAQALWRRLSDGGKVLMPLAAYPFADLYGWTEDRYGLSWQIMFAASRAIKQKITPAMMFTGANAGKAGEAIEFYASIFPGSGVEHIARYGKGEQPNEEGSVRHVSFRLAGQYFAAMDSAHAHGFTFNEAVSLLVTCEHQDEIDRYSDLLSADPRAEQCGWLKDKYGVSWQIAPGAMGQMMANGSREQIARVTRAFLPMKRFNIAALKRAYDGD